jgi:hypothetical protein
MAAMVVSTLGGAPSTMVAVVSSLAEVLLRDAEAMRAGAWGMEAAEEDRASTEAADTKVMGTLVLVEILSKVNRVGRDQVEIFQMLEVTIGVDRGITTIILG